VASTAVIALASNAGPHRGVGWPVWVMVALCFLTIAGLVVFKRQ
jgi:hypothetical protein